MRMVRSVLRVYDGTGLLLGTDGTISTTSIRWNSLLLGTDGTISTMSTMELFINRYGWYDQYYEYDRTGCY